MSRDIIEAPTGIFHFAAPTAYQWTFDNGQLVVQVGGLTINGGGFTIAAGGGAATFNGVLTPAGHIVGGGTAPTASGAATSSIAASLLAGTDQGGRFLFNTIASGMATGAQATVLFATAYAATPNVVISPANGPAASINMYVTSSVNSFTVNANIVPLASATYAVNYLVIG
jgi:hypothetical protein